MRLGLLGGTFDPPHLGHLELARAVRSARELDRVLLMPAADPPHKEESAITPSPHRLRMLELAIDGQAGLGVSEVELRRGGVSYTVDTLREVRGGLSAGDELCFIMGADSLAELATWRDVPGILAVADLIVASRPGYRLDPDGALLELIGPAGSARLEQGLVPIDALPISSTDIRRRVRCGEPWESLVPPAVAGYIREHGLYR